MKELTRDQVAAAVKQIRTNEGFSGPADDGGDAATVEAFMCAQTDIRAKYGSVGTLPVAAIVAILKQILPIFIRDTNIVNTINTVLDLIAKFF